MRAVVAGLLAAGALLATGSALADPPLAPHENCHLTLDSKKLYEDGHHAATCNSKNFVQVHLTWHHKL